MSTLKTITIVFILALLGCQSNDNYVPDFSDKISYKYSETKYFSNADKDNYIVSIKYINDQKQLIEQVGHEYRVKYIYDENGRLTETFNCRIYNCDIGLRSILIYDSAGNNIGTYRTLDTIVNIDTVKIDQVKFYDEENHLIKELADRGNNVYGDKYEVWKLYQYDNERVILELEIKNSDTVWSGTYDYDNNGNLKKIKRQNKEKYETELFEYDQKNRLKKWIIESNAYPLTDDCFYSTTNNSTIYEYNDKGQPIKETTYNHKGDIYRTFKYQYNDKKQKH